jgi:hypothetical protein
MFARKGDEPFVETVVAEPSAPEVTKAQKLERSLNTATTFASRRATGAPVRAPRLVSLGWHERTVTTNTRGGQRVVEVELLYDRDNTTERSYRTRGVRPEPMFETGTAPTDVVTALPPIRGEPRLAGAFPDSLP